MCSLFFSTKANAGGSGRDPLQAARQPEESAAPGATATLPGQYKQRTPMYNASSAANPATPTSPSTPGSTPASNGPPAAATASQQETPTQPPSTPQTQTPTPAPTAPQPQPKKNLSLTVSRGPGHADPRGKKKSLRKAEFLVVLLRETRCTPPRRCSRPPTRSPDRKKLSFWVSWLDPEVTLLQLKKISIISLASDASASCVCVLQRTHAPSKATSSRSS